MKTRSSGFKLKRSKIEYIKCKFRKIKNNELDMITFNGKIIPADCFKYPKSIIQKDEKINKDINHKIMAE